MAIGNEKRFENKVKKFLKDNGCWYIKYWAGAAYTKAGIPDLIVCCNGRFVAIEIKAKGGKLSELQKYNLNEINKAGGLGIALYPDDFEKFKHTIRMIKLCNGLTLK